MIDKSMLPDADKIVKFPASFTAKYNDKGEMTETKTDYIELTLGDLFEYYQRMFYRSREAQKHMNELSEEIFEESLAVAGERLGK